MLRRVIVKSLLRRRASRNALAKLSAFKGAGIGRMFISRAAFVLSVCFTSVCVLARELRPDYAYNA